MRLRTLAAPALLAALLPLAATPAAAWSRDTHLALAETVAPLAPRDLARQIERHELQLRQGVLAAWGEASSKPAHKALADEAERAVEAIERHRPFADIVHQLGVVLYWVAAVNDPLAVAGRDAATYRDDYAAYVDSARPRFRVAFYGEGRKVESERALTRLVAAAGERGRAYAPLVGAEYERIGFGRGIDGFDDRSTAFGLAALAYSHAASDAVGTLRYIWLRSGGADRRELPRLTPP